MENVALSKSQKRQEARLGQILDAAAACFVKEGFHGTSMAKVAKEASMSVGHIYHYFENKDAIIKALVQRENELVDQKMLDLEDASGDSFLQSIREKLIDGIQKQVDPFQSVLNMEILAEGQRNPEIAALLHATDEKVRTHFMTIFRDKLGLDNPEGRIEMLFTIFHGVPSRMLRNPSLTVDQFKHVILATLDVVLGVDRSNCRSSGVPDEDSKLPA